MILDSINSPQDLKKLDINQLQSLAAEIREELLRTVPVTGGHLAANMGVVELTIALHYVLNMPEDKVVWDVGHQTYVHKMLTGRRDRMDTIRHLNGLCGFPKTTESEYDSFGTGHSSTSISAALGMALARDMNGDEYSVAAVIGDGSMTGGLAFEGLNNCGQQKSSMMIILNDNEMSISKNVGALSHYLSKIRTSARYNITKLDVKKFLSKIPFVGNGLVRIAERVKAALKAIVMPNVLFEQLGVKYMGIVDGHNIKKLIRTFELAKGSDTPVLVHVKTKKGKGEGVTEAYPQEFHSVSENCDLNAMLSETEQNVNGSFSLFFGNRLCEMAAENENIVAITAAMTDGTGLTSFAKQYKKRFFDVGIAEQHAVTFAAGLAMNGKKPFVALYSSFLQRAYDQVIHDVCIQRLPVVFCIDRAGISGRDGETHNGQFDIAFLQHIPNIEIFAPSSINEAKMAIDYAATAQGPVAIRYGKCKPNVHNLECDNIFDWKYDALEGDEEAVIFACGSMVKIAIEAAKKCEQQGIKVTVVNMLCVKPLDEKALEAMSGIKKWVVAEDGVINGGIGSTVSMYVSERALDIRVKHIGIKDKFIPHGSITELFEIYEMDVNAIVKCILEDK